MLGTPKQNAFIIKLGAALGFVNLMTAVNTALARPLNTAIPSPFIMAEASKVIAALLEKCAAAGISTFSAKGKGKGKRKASRRAPAPAAVPPPVTQPPLPATTPPGGRTVAEALAALADEAKILFRRGCTDAEIRKACGLTVGYTTEELEAELRTRGKFVSSVVEALAKAQTVTLAKELACRDDRAAQMHPISTEDLCGELERRGLPAGFLITDPDAVAAAPRALDWIDWNFGEVDPQSAREQAAEILRDAGRTVKD